MQLINPTGNGIITVTNKRLLCTTNELSETELDNITGIVSKYKSKFSAVKIILFFLLSGLAAACFMAATSNVIDLASMWATMPSWFKWVLYSGGGISAISAFFIIITVNKKEFHIQIYTKASQALMSYKGTIGKAKHTAIRVRPGKESKYIVHELGAVILEAKSGKYNN